MKSLLILKICLLTCFASIGQTISDYEFEWKKNNDCLSEERSIEIFKKVEQDPIITEFNKQQFKNFIQESIQNLNLPKNQNGVLKLKLLFEINQNLCIKEIGVKELDLSQGQIDQFFKTLSSIDQFKAGKQRGIEVNCLGILYINIRNGKVDKFRIVNFQF